MNFGSSTPHPRPLSRKGRGEKKNPPLNSQDTQTANSPLKEGTGSERPSKFAEVLTSPRSACPLFQQPAKRFANTIVSPSTRH